MSGYSSQWALLIVAGASNATFGLPMKYVRRWEWENTWAVWTVLALIVLPVLAASACVPSLASVYRATGMGPAGTVFLFGAGWGLAQVLFGLAMDLIGIGLTFSIVLGISAAAGSVLPMWSLGTGGAPAMERISTGLVLVALGVTACAEAGRRRERAQSSQAGRSGSFAPGLIMALVSGVLASLMNVGFAAGGPLTAAASALGASDTASVFAVWLPLLWGGAVPNLLYCIYRLNRRKTWGCYRGPSPLLNLCLAAAMALLWFFGTSLYGVASHALGPWGVILGWPVFMSVIVIGAGLLSFATGEWKNSGRKPVIFQAAGILLLVLAIVSFANAQNVLRRGGKVEALRSSPPEPHLLSRTSPPMFALSSTGTAAG